MRVLSILLFASLAQGETFRFGRVWDGERMLTNAVIVVEKDRIVSVGAGPAEAADLSRYTALPGLIDVHTHLTYVRENPAISQSGRAAATVFLSQDNARKTLASGVTTVRNLGAASYQDIAMRD